MLKEELMIFTYNIDLINKTIRFLFGLTVLLGGSILTSCAQKPDPLRIGVFSDPHFLTPQLMDDGEAIQQYDLSSGKVIREVPFVLEQVLQDYLNSDIEILLIPGDMTKDGEKQSHIDFVKQLQPLINKGVKVYVIPGNHDINRPDAMEYKGENRFKTDNVTPQEFADIYAGYGYKDALRRDANSLSYVAELNTDTWLLAIDSNKYDEYTQSSVTSGGRISPETEKWIELVMNEAHERNIQVIGMMHHGLVEHIMMQATFFSEYVVDDWQRLASFFADQGVKVMFTGHFHANDITEFASRQGNKIYDIETGSLAAYPFPYRFIELYKEKINVSTKNIISTPASPRLSEQNKITLQDKAKNIAVEKMRQRGMQFPPKTTQLITDIVAKVFVMHAAGDETLDDELKETIRQLSLELGSPADISPDLLGLDMYPSDNNVEIKF